MRRPGLGVHLALLFVQLSFAAWAVLGKLALGELGPLELAGLRAAGAVPIFLVLARAAGVRPARGDLPRLVALGASGVLANQLLYVFGLRLTTATNAAIIQTAIPVFTAALAAAFGVERIGARQGVGVTLAVGGALFMLAPAALGAPAAHLGDLMIMGNTLCYSVYLVLQRPLLLRMPAMAVTSWAYVFGGVPLALVALPTLARADLAAVTAPTWGALAFIVLVPTTLNYLLISFAIQRSSAALAATYTTLQPLAASLMAALFLGERAGPRQAAGLGLIVLGLVAVTRRSASAGPSDRSAQTSAPGEAPPER